MNKFAVFLSVTLFSGVGFAKPCIFDQRSCLELKNQTSLAASVKCNGLEVVSANQNAQGSTQLDLGSNDGMGTPAPVELECILSTPHSKKSFDFLNPYWGPLIEFTLISPQELNVRINDRWGGKSTYYSYKW